MNVRDIFCVGRELLFPAACPVCGEEFSRVDDCRFGICWDCRPLFDLSLEKRCVRCGKPLISEREICMNCRNKDTLLLDGGFLIYPYAGHGKDVLAEYKFGKNRALGHFFAGKIIEAAEIITKNAKTSPCFVPVPPKPRKIKEKGWDQVEYLAKIIGKTSHLSVSRCLKRLESRSQKELNGEARLLNLKGRIQCAKQPPREALLIDDVFTTGATLDACAQALKNGGAEKVWGICLFYD